MAWDHPTWGEKRIANDLVLKLALRISPHTVRTYLPKPLHRARHHRLSSQRWLTFVRKHAKAMVAGDFWIVVATTFRLLYVFVVMEHATGRILHAHVTAHPSAQWPL